MLNIEYNLLNYNNYNGILKYLNISNKIYSHTIDNNDIEKNDTEKNIIDNNDVEKNTIEKNTTEKNITEKNDVEKNDVEKNDAIDRHIVKNNSYDIIIPESLDFDLVDFENSIDNISIIKSTKDHTISTISTKEIFINKYFNKLNMLININMQKSINWCRKHNFTVNKEFLNE
jgi:hypothetical protein